MIFFRDQNIDLEQQKAFGRRFGKLHIHPTAPSAPGHPEVLVVKADANSKAVAGNRWHTDVSCDVEPPMGSILHMRELPATGGDTMFANMYAAYEALSQPMQAFLSGLKAWHESEHVLGGTLGQKLHDGAKEYPRALHPVVRTHPETGRKCLYVNSGFTTRIEGLGREGEPRGPRYAVRSRPHAGVPVPLPLAAKLRGVLGQPLGAALRAVGLLPALAARLSRDHLRHAPA